MKTGPFARTLTLLVSLAVVPSACGDSPTENSRETPSFVIGPPNQWSGGTVRVESTALAADSADIEVVTGSDTLEFAVVEPGAIEVTLPEEADGVLQIDVVVEGERYDAGEVEAYGFVESRLLAPALHRGIQEWPAAFGVAVVGGKGSGQPQDANGVAILNLTTGVSSAYDSIHNFVLQYWPGISANPGEIYLRPDQNTNVLWRLSTAVPPAPLDSLPAFQMLGGNNWSLARLDSDLWISAGHHRLGVFRGPDQGGGFNNVYSIQAEETHGYVFLRQANRVVPLSNYFAGDGIPAFDTRSGDIAFRVKDLKSSFAVAADPVTNEFIMAGLDTLAVFGGGRTHSVVIVDGVTGATKRSRSLDFTPLDAEYEPVSGLIYLVTGESILILDKESLETRGHMLATEGADWWDIELVLSPDEGLAYIVYGDSSNNGTVVHTFRLLPGR